MEKLLGFELPPVNGFPGGWHGAPNGTIFADDKVVHGGQWSARLERGAASPQDFSTITNFIPVDFGGSRIEIRGFLRTENVSGFSGLWLREDGDSPTLAFDNMQNRQLKGTTEWQEYSIVLPLHPEAKTLVFGALMVGTGKTWVDDLQLLVDGKPVSEVPKVVRQQTVLDTDHEFDANSGIHLPELNATQIANLATLARVWGFLKYHHPKVIAGERQWDYDLFRVMPAVLAAPDRESANTAILQWIDALGPVQPCKQCVQLQEKDLALRPAVEWIRDEKLLGPHLSERLRSIYQDRPKNEKQFYVSLMPNVQNPSFDHELSYGKATLPDSGFQILALFRFWNIVEYWSPYREIVGEDWNDVLKQLIPPFALAKDKPAYERELFALLALDHDTHANLWSNQQDLPPVGDCRLPVAVRFVGDQPAIWWLNEAGKSDGFERGDVIVALDGFPVAKLVANWTPYYAASNDARRLHDIGISMTRGQCGQAHIRVRRGEQELELTPARVPAAQVQVNEAVHDLPGGAFRLLSKDVAYLKLSSVKASEIPQYLHSAAGTKGLIIDIRNYPSEFVVFSLGSHLMSGPTPFARFTNGDLSTPGAFHWTEPEVITPESPPYNGKIVILADETSLSQAEYTTMAFRAAPGAVVVGSTTAGADGNVSPIPLPGSFNTMISGIGVFYPDRRATQRVGIVPNIVVNPTIAGLRDGRDEVLEEAVRQIVGEDTSVGAIQKMIQP